MTTTSAIDPQTLLARRRPEWSLERAFYTDPGIYAADIDRVWKRNWLYVGHVSRVRLPGQYFLADVAGESLIIIRGKDGAVNALYNVCRHRGSRICLEPSGTAKALVCPYHQWSYQADGTLTGARFMPEGFDRSKFGMHRARVEVAAGLIFVALSDDAPSFAPVARDLERFLAPNGMADRATICHTHTARVKANWKLVVENFRECYHCEGSHPEYLSAVSWGKKAKNQQEHDERVAAAEQGRERWKAQGLDVDGTAFSADTFHHCGRGPLKPGYQSWSLDGKPTAPLMGSQTERENWLVGFVMYPNFFLEGGCDYISTTRVLPISACESEIEINWHVHQDAVAGVDYDVERVTAVWKATAEQDLTLVQNNHAGVESERYEPGPYSTMEAPDIEHFLSWYARQLSAPAMAAGRGCKHGE
ncbi:MAG: aromatic ring-hydroxylating dioxygenase subunit alpha [Planctomycetes bacterium]|nr:aromatic ring-hydroxylating dioxygenase subunit alpha [Planctomycetota bacterium]